MCVREQVLNARHFNSRDVLDCVAHAELRAPVFCFLFFFSR